MAHLSTPEVFLLKRGAELLGLEVITPETLTNAELPFSTFSGLQNYIVTQEMNLYVANAVAVTSAALRNVSQVLLEAHSQAANITVSAPNDGELKKFRDLMNDVNTAIQGDQVFRQTLGLASELAKSLAETSDSALA